MEGKNFTYTCEETGDYYIRIDVNKKGCTHKFWNFKIIEGEEKTEYSNYNEGTITVISKNGDDISYNVVSSKPLCCLKDAEGKIIAQDYVDYSKQIVHRECGYIKTYNQEIINTNYISSTGELTAGATIVYKLPEAIEEDINCINGLTQYAEQTEIYNTDGAEIEVELTSNKAISSLNKEIHNLQENNNIQKDNIKNIETKMQRIELDLSKLELQNGYSINNTFDNRIYKQGNIVCLNMVLNKSSGITTQSTAFKLPQEFRPIKNTVFIGGLALYSGYAINNTCMVFLGNSGDLQIRNDTTTTYTTVVLNLTFKCNN